MCRLAFAHLNCEISDIELERSGKSYTVYTLRELKKIYPDDELFFIIGSEFFINYTINYNKRVKEAKV